MEKLFRGDFIMARKFCELAQPAHLPFLDETEKQFMTEFDYILEAKNLVEIGNNINDNPLWRDKIVVPKPYIELCTKNVLCMEWLKGKKFIKAIKDNYTEIAKLKGLSFDEFMEEQKNKPKPSVKELERIKMNIKIRDSIWNGLAFMVNNSFGYVFYLLGNRDQNIIDYKSTIIPLNIKYYLDLCMDIHGYELIMDGAFNADPHAGNLLILNDGRMGLIDYGQVKHLTINDRILLSKLILSIKNNDKDSIIKHIKSMGLQSKYMNNDIMETRARFMFDRDDIEFTGNMNPQLFMEKLDKIDPITKMSDTYVMVARLKLLMSGLYHALGYTLIASDYWAKWANMFLNENDVSK